MTGLLASVRLRLLAVLSGGEGRCRGVVGVMAAAEQRNKLFIAHTKLVHIGTALAEILNM